MVEIDFYVLEDNSTDSGDTSLSKEFKPKDDVNVLLSEITNNPPEALTDRGVTINGIVQSDYVPTEAPIEDEDWTPLAIALPIVLVLLAALATALALLIPRYGPFTPEW